MFFITAFGMANVAFSQNFITHDFDDGKFGAFKECTTQSPNYASVNNGRVKTYWTEDSYNGSRMTKGAEICSKEDWSTRKEGWYGLTMNLGSDYPNDKRAGVAQIFQFVSSSLWTWAAMLIIDDGDLNILHRDNAGTSRNSEETIYSNLPKNRDFDIVMHFILSNKNKGELQIWIDGESRYHKQNINFGFGSWKDDVQTSQYTYVDLKAGQYNFEDNDYDYGETRTVYYDNIAWFDGENGYSKVDPSNGSNTEVNTVLENGVSKADLSASKNAETFYTIDVPQGASNLVFNIAGNNGDADLYVRKSNKPTTSQYDHRPYKNGSNETVTINSPSADTYHVMLRAYSSYSNVTLTASFDENGSGNGDNNDGDDNDEDNNEEDNSCSGCTNYQGNLGYSGDTDYQPDGSYFRSNNGGTFIGNLQGPSNTDFDLRLLKWNGGAWATVAKSETPTSLEAIQYSGTSGYYTWRVRSYSGSGNYTLQEKHP